MHLLHPAFVHFAVAFLVSGGILEIVGALGRRPQVWALGGKLLVAGTVLAVPTVITGFVAQNSVALPEGASALMERHETVGLIVLGLFSIVLFWKGWLGGRIPESQRWPYAAVVLLGILLVGYGAFLGGDMVYGHGVGVAPR